MMIPLEGQDDLQGEDLERMSLLVEDLIVYSPWLLVVLPTDGANDTTKKYHLKDLELDGLTSL